MEYKSSPLKISGMWIIRTIPFWAPSNCFVCLLPGASPSVLGSFHICMPRISIHEESLEDLQNCLFVYSISSLAFCLANFNCICLLEFSILSQFKVPLGCVLYSSEKKSLRVSQSLREGIIWDHWVSSLRLPTTDAAGLSMFIQYLQTFIKYFWISDFQELWFLASYDYLEFI